MVPIYICSKNACILLPYLFSYLFGLNNQKTQIPKSPLGVGVCKAVSFQTAILNAFDKEKTVHITMASKAVSEKCLKKGGKTQIGT